MQWNDQVLSENRIFFVKKISDKIDKNKKFEISHFFYQNKKFTFLEK